MNNDLLAQIAALPKAPFPKLKKLWKDLFDSDLPGLNRTHIVNRLTYRLQELAWDDKTGSLEQRLDAMVKARLTLMWALFTGWLSTNALKLIG